MQLVQIVLSVEEFRQSGETFHCSYHCREPEVIGDSRPNADVEDCQQDNENLDEIEESFSESELANSVVCLTLTQLRNPAEGKR